MQYHNSIVIEKDHAVSRTLLMTLVLMLTTFSIHLPAKTVAEIWKTMPDTIVPYLDPQQRQEMPSYASMHVDGSVDNLLGGKCRMDTLTDSYAHIQLNATKSLQLKLLPISNQDSIICLVETWLADSDHKAPIPTGESTIRFFSQDWKELPTPQYLGVPSVNDLADMLTTKPDTMSELTYKTLKEKIDPKMVLAEISAEDNTLRLRLSRPLLSDEEYKELHQVLVIRQLSWSNGSYHSVNQQ